MNNDTRYRVIFSGQAQPPVTSEQLQAHLTQRFRLPPGKARAMMGRGDVVIKKHLPKEDAMRYLAALQQIGAVARLEVEVPQAPHQAATPPPKPSAAPTTTSPPADKRNPKATAEHNPYAAPRARVADAETTEYGELHFFTVQGRIGRLRYLVWGTALMFIIAGLGVALTMLLGSKPASAFSSDDIVVMIVFVLLALYPGICMQAQRLHDIGISAWLMLLGAIPFVGGLFNFALLCWPGKKEENKYGLPPPPNSIAIKIIACVLFLVVLLGSALVIIGINLYRY